MENFYYKKIQELKYNKIENPEFDLRLLIKYSLKTQNNNYLLKDLKIHLIDLKKFNYYFNRRIKGEPISKIINKKEFWSLNFFINKDVLDPRPETEYIIEAVKKYNLNKNERLSFCDLGTGSGCIIISLLRYYNNSYGLGLDLSHKAINIAKKNAIKHKVINRLKLISMNWKKLYEKFDILVSNPPYIKVSDYYNLKNDVKNYDPKLALIGGKTGYEKFEELGQIVNNCMNKSSIFVTEIGYNQKKYVVNIFNQNNLELFDVIKDLSGIERVLIFKKKQ